MNYAYPIAIKKKPTRTKRHKREKTFQIHPPPVDWEHMYMGSFVLGTFASNYPSAETFEDFGTHTHACIVCDENADILKIMENDSTVWSICLQVDTPMIVALVQSKQFFFQPYLQDDAVALKVYFKALPMLTKGIGGEKHGIGNFFKMLFNIGVDQSLKGRKNIDNLQKVEKLFKCIRQQQLQDFNMVNNYTNSKHSNGLNARLRPYQESAVEWMLNKEKMAKEYNANYFELDPSYVELKLPSKLVYYDQYSVQVVEKKPLIEVSVNGAILADEMGLGKTIEVLALILSDFDEDEAEEEKEEDVKPIVISVHRQRKRPAYDIVTYSDASQQIEDVSQGGSLRERMVSMYQSTLVSVWDKPQRKKQEVACICGSFEERNLRTCVDCGKKQHYNCVGYNDKTCGPFRCSQCWSKLDAIASNGTLIVCPASLSQQWLNEITKHVGRKLNVLCYDGSNTLTPVYPTKLATYDIVVTSYTVLQNEFHLVDQCAGKSLRNQRKYSSPGSPISYIQWKRLCLDEAQTVESTGSMIASMAQRLRANFRWAITGTPVSLSISDIYGLIEYLHLSPYNDPEIFANTLYQPFLAGNEAPLTDFLAKVLWRTKKCDVLEQIDIPPQTVRYHTVDFTQVERYFYDCETRECRKLFMQKAARVDACTQLMSMSHREFTGLFQPVSALRRVCIHHNVVNGRYLLTKKPVNSMQELLDALIARNVNDCDEHLRMIIAAYNGLAGVYLLLNNPLTAAEYYVKIMLLEEKYSKPAAGSPETAIRVDKLPLIHMYYNLGVLLHADDNLAENLYASQAVDREVALSVAQLKIRQEWLEHEYVQKFEHQTKQVIQSLSALTDSIGQLDAQITHETWYADLIVAAFATNSKDTIMTRLAGVLGDLTTTKFRPSQSFITEFIMTWIESIRKFRETAMESVNSLYEITAGERITFTTEIVSETVDCHLREDKSNKKKKAKKDCRFCLANAVLLQYEGVLYRDEKGTTGKQRDWRPAEQEQILPLLVRMGSSGLMKGNVDEASDAPANAKVFMEMLELQKKEFKELRKAWMYLEAQLCANDELVICKTRLQLKNDDEDDESGAGEVHRSLRQLSYEIANNLVSINQLSEHEVDLYRFNLEQEQRNQHARLEKCLGTNKYLVSLHSKDSQNMDPCPICRSPLEKSWNMMQCGHAYCLPCMETIVEHNKSKKITCAVCRHVQPLAEINCVDETLLRCKADAAADGEGEIRVQGNCSSKVGSIVRLIKQLKQENAHVKVLVFTSFSPVMKILKDIFEQNEIKSLVLMNGGQMVKTVEDFKAADKGVTALVLPVSVGAKGLNLIEATHVIFAEPILDPAEELQAIGRVHRIGQKQKTVVHKFIMRDSIEASIQRVTSAKDNSKWTRSEITVGQLRDLLFGVWDSDDEQSITAEEEVDSQHVNLDTIDIDEANINVNNFNETDNMHNNQDQDTSMGESLNLALGSDEENRAGVIECD